MLEVILLAVTAALSFAAFVVALLAYVKVGETAKLTSDGFIAAINTFNYGTTTTDTAQAMPLEAPDLPESDFSDEGDLVDPFYHYLEELGENPETGDQVAGMYYTAKRDGLI